MKSVVQRAKEHPSAVLLAGQLLAVLLYPSIGASTSGRAWLSLVSILFLSLAIWAVHVTPASTRTAAGWGLLTAILTIVEIFRSDVTAVVVTSAAVHAIFYLFVTYALLRYLFADLIVTVDEIYAIGATFTVLAWAFAYLIVAAQAIWSGAFVPWDPNTPFFNALFMSFTTLTSVGLSDILPVTGHARALIMLEEFAGVMYLALVVSRLVGLTVSRSRSGN